MLTHVGGGFRRDLFVSRNDDPSRENCLIDDERCIASLPIDIFNCRVSFAFTSRYKEAKFILSLPSNSVVTFPSNAD